MNNGQLTIIVSPGAIYFNMLRSNTIIVHCQFSIVNSFGNIFGILDTSLFFILKNGCALENFVV